MNQKAMLLASDALCQLNSAKLRLTGLGYITGRSLMCSMYTDGRNVSDAVDEITSNCSMCALGTMLVSAASSKVRDRPLHEFLHNTLTSRRVRDELAGIFSMEQLDYIETAFMGVAYTCSEEARWNLVQIARNLLTNADYHTRLRYIMTNILENDGLFWPKEFDA